MLKTKNNQKEKILNKAKNTIYKHNIWFCDGSKTVYEAIKYFVNHSDMKIDLKGSIKHIDDIEGYNGKPDRSQIIQYCIDNFDDHWDKLIINSTGRGTDRGKLKLQTYLILDDDCNYLT